MYERAFVRVTSVASWMGITTLCALECSPRKDYVFLVVWWTLKTRPIHIWPFWCHLHLPKNMLAQLTDLVVFLYVSSKLLCGRFWGNIVWYVCYVHIYIGQIWASLSARQLVYGTDDFKSKHIRPYSINLFLEKMETAIWLLTLIWPWNDLLRMKHNVSQQKRWV